MALGPDRSRASTTSGVKASASRPATSSSVSVLHDIDDLYENNAFEDDDDDNDSGIRSSRNGAKPRDATVAGRKTDKNTAQTRGPRTARNSNNNSAAATATTGAQTKPTPTAKQLGFDVWVARKDKYERTAAALAELNTERAASDAQWLDVAVSLAAIDCVLKTGKTDACDCPGVCRDVSHSVTKQRTRCQCPAKKCSLCRRCVNTTPGAITPKMNAALAPFRVEPTQSLLALAELIVQTGEGRSLHDGSPRITAAVVRIAQTVLAQCSILESADGTRIQRPCTCPVRSLGDLWVKWTTRYHTFSRAPLTESEASKFSSGTRQMMELEDDKATQTKTYYMTLKWHQAAKPQKGDTAKIAARRQLTADQKRQNAFFLSLCKQHWLIAQHRVVEHLQAKMAQFDALSAADKKRTNAVASSAEMEVSILNRLGTKRILQWLEDDRDAIQDKRDDDAREKAEGGVIAHSAWVKRKDRLRIRMPAALAGSTGSSSTTAAAAVPKPGGSWKPPRFDFSTGKGVVRNAKVRVPSSTVELMRSSGLKYVHAMSEGFQGRGGDLEKCRQLLVKKGHVLKANFTGTSTAHDDDDDAAAPFSKDRYAFEKTHNVALRKRRDGDAMRHEQSKESYDAWLAHKAMRDKAIKFLAHIPSPRVSASASTRDSDRYNNNDGDNGNDDDTVPASVRWEEVGKALKAVDRTLLDDWVRWSDGYKSTAQCRMLWDSFAPIACDVHCASSALRDVFLKLLHRKSVNYRRAVVDHCALKHRKLLARGDARAEELGGDDDVADDALIDAYGSLSPSEFTRLLLSLGLVLAPDDVQRLVAYFSGSGDAANNVPIAAFLDVVGDKRRAQCHGDTDAMLKHVCMWETVCHECGMLPAFQLVASSASGASAQRMRSELPGHMKRRELNRVRFDCTPERDLQVVKTTAPKRCAFAAWTDAAAAPSLKKLELWSAETREQYVLQQLVSDGAPPGAPTLVCDMDDDNAIDATTQLLLRWTAPPVTHNNGAAFYILETIGAEGSTSFRLNDYREVVRDPNDYQDNNGEPRYYHVVSGLSPNTKYGFRIRALNGFGAGAFTFAYFVTAPSPPPAPRAVRLSAHSVHLSWESASYYRRQLAALRAVFDDADADGDGVISRDEFMDELERRKPRLLEFLQRTAVRDAGRNGNGPSLSVFDAIETDDNECIAWDEFVRFFHGVVDDADDEASSSSTGSSLAKSHLTAKSHCTTTATSSTTKSKRSSAASTPACRFILKQCVNEAAGEYVEIYRGTATTFVVHGLASGSTYQFRVQALNDAQLASRHSASVVVNTLLQTPAAPTLAIATDAASALSATSAKLRWPPATARPSLSHEALQARAKSTTKTGSHGPASDDTITRILKEWAHETSLDDASVDFRAKFDKYDVDSSGFLELPEFATFLDELGVRPTPERLAAYVAAFDTDHDGKVSYREFTRWWNRTDSVEYVLKRDNGRSSKDLDRGATPQSAASAASASASNDMRVVTYRGTDTSALVRGLSPNTLYTFRVRVVSAHSSSELSDGLEVWTAPSAPTGAGVISALATVATIVWYPGVGGAYRFIVECKLVETLSEGPSTTSTAARRTGAAAPITSSDWRCVYDGAESLATLSDLVPNTVYRVRVFALNRAGGRSDQSTVTQFCTADAHVAALKPSNAADHFVVECSAPDDIVAGDTVLFSERIVQSASGKVVSEEAARALVSGSGRFGSTATLQTSSVYSVSSSATGASSNADVVGERTVAARVVTIKPHARYGAVVTMLVVWCTVQLYDDGRLTAPPARRLSKAAAKATANRLQRTANSIHATSHNVMLATNATYALVADTTIMRKATSLFRFDTFRLQWHDEHARHASTWDA